MSERLSEVILDDLEITLDFLDSESWRNVFLGELLERRADMLEVLLDKGGDEMRFKIQMLDEVIGLREDISAELKSRKSQMD